MSKDNPLEPEDVTPSRPGYRTEHRTLWLDKAGMAEARQNYYRAYADAFGAPSSDSLEASHLTQREVWNTAWAAAIAAYSYLMEGRITP